MASITREDLKVGFTYKTKSGLNWIYQITKIDDKMVYDNRVNAPKCYSKSGKLLQGKGNRLGIEKFISEFDKNYEVVK